MVRKSKKNDSEKCNYTKTKSFENLESVQQMALNRKGKDDELNPDISLFLKAEELKGKLCGLYSDKEKSSSNINIMGSVKVDGIELKINAGEEIKMERKND